MYGYNAVTTAGVMRWGMLLGQLWPVRAALKLSTVLAQVALSSRVFQSWIVFTENEFLDCWVLGFWVLKQFEWFMQNFSTILELTFWIQLRNNFAYICYQYKVTCKLSMAGTIPLTILIGKTNLAFFQHCSIFCVRVKVELL